MIFVDAGAWIAICSKRDQYHAVAQERWKRFTTKAPRFSTSNLVLGEALNILARESSYEFAATQGRRILAMPGLTLLRPVEEDEQTALNLMTKWADQKIGFVDCLSFALMRRHRIKTAFAFDRHFEIAGFKLLE